MLHLSRLWVDKGKKGLNLPCSQWNVCRGWGRIMTLWLMIKPDGHSAGAKRVELHPSGSWCNDIRNVEISVLV